MLSQSYSLLLFMVACSIFLLSAHAQAMPARAAMVELVEETPGVVYGVTQDQHDFLWLAAEFEGLLRYDGQQYLRFSPPGPRRSISMSQVVVDARNQLWIGTWGSGLWRLDSLRKDWQKIAAPIPADARIQTLLIGRDQSLWIGTTQGLYRLNAETMQAEIWQPLAGKRVWQMAQQENGTLWVATSNGLYQLQPTAAAQSKWLPHAAFSDKEIRTVALQGQQLLVGLRANLYLLDVTQPDLIQQLDFGNSNAILAESPTSWLVGSIDGLFRIQLTPTGLQSDSLRAAVDVRLIFRDRRDQIWLASRNLGLQRNPQPPLRLVEPSLNAFLNTEQPHRLGPPSVTNTRWQALENSVLQLKDNRWRELPFLNETPVSYVRDVVQFGPHTVAATDQGLFKLAGDSHFEKVSLSFPVKNFEIESMAVAADGALWLGLRDHGVVRISAEQAQHEPSQWQVLQLVDGFHELEWIVAMHTDPQKRLWLLSRHGKLYHATPDAITLRWQPDSSLITGYFRCMLAVQDELWLCADRGLLKVSNNLQQTEVWGQAQGLPDLRVIGLARTDEFVWVLTRNGVLNFRPDGSDLHLLNSRQSLDLTTAQLGGISTLADDQVQLATSSGLFQLSQADMTQVPAAMQLHLTSLRLNRQLYSIAETNDHIVMAEKIDELQLQFKLLTFQPHLRVQYFFRWHNQHEWSAMGQEAVLNLSQLSPGLHQLEVMAQAGGQLIQTAPLRLQIPIPFWQQPVGILFMSITSALALWGLYHVRTRRLQQRAANLDIIVAQRTAELESANQQLQLLSNTDSLTKLQNRRALYASAAMLQTQRSRTATALTLVLMDIDHFKKINDSNGHDAGDAVLIAVANYLKQRLRAQDLIARWGGEEFLLLMPQTDVPQTQRLMEELRHGITQIQVKDLTTPLSATFGLSAVGTEPDALEKALKAADLALYQGKAQGRNQVVLALTADNPSSSTDD